VDPPDEHDSNFLLFGYGETTAPITERAFIGSLTISRTTTKSQPSTWCRLPRHRRAEIERFLATGPSRRCPIRSTTVTSTAAFDLMRRTLEDATGGIDFELASTRTPCGATDQCLAARVDVRCIQVNAFYFEGGKYRQGRSSKDHRKLSGLQ